MFHALLGDAKFWALLLEVDLEIVRIAQAAGCFWCSGRLDRGDYPRKPRGIPWSVESEHARRPSLCCATLECRRRQTPPSVRFFGRRVYAAPLFLVGCLIESLAHAIATARTRRRWLTWWRTVFIMGTWWQGARGLLASPIDESALPGSLLARFAFPVEVALVKCLRFLAPSTAAPRARSTMGP